MKGSAHGNGNLLDLIGEIMSNNEIVICKAAVHFTGYSKFVLLHVGFTLIIMRLLLRI